MSDVASVDRERIDAVCGGSEEIAIELLGMLVDEAEPIIAALNECVRCNDVLQTNELSHALKGISGNVGAYELRDAAMSLETVSEKIQAPASHLGDIQLAAIVRAFERVCDTHRSWQARAARNAGIFTS
jgi:HPt (histidine-containing phosphotransfer) domain-containing protein